MRTQKRKLEDELTDIDVVDVASPDSPSDLDSAAPKQIEAAAEVPE